jgi:hypothetical protein
LVWLIYAGFYEFPRLIPRKLPYLPVTRSIAKVEQSLLEIKKVIG